MMRISRKWKYYTGTFEDERNHIQLQNEPVCVPDYQSVFITI
jgi:hypothetical protein